MRVGASGGRLSPSRFKIRSSRDPLLPAFGATKVEVLKGFTGLPRLHAALLDAPMPRLGVSGRLARFAQLEQLSISTGGIKSELRRLSTVGSGGYTLLRRRVRS